jgi:CRP-like cAMP-binding protein
MPAAPDPRLDQMFPRLSPEEIDRLRRFGTIRRYAAGVPVVTTGEVDSGMFVLISGTVAVSARGGLGHVIPIIELGPGGFLAEVGMLAGQPRLVDARATSDTDVLVLPADRRRRSSRRSCAIASGRCARADLPDATFLDSPLMKPRWPTRSLSALRASLASRWRRQPRLQRSSAPARMSASSAIRRPSRSRRAAYSLTSTSRTRGSARIAPRSAAPSERVKPSGCGK